jgi:chorismate mutase/prephenate dehydratase
VSLDEHRKRIDEIDTELIRLLNERIRSALHIGSLKSKSKQEVYTPAREREVLERVRSLNEGPIRDESLQAIYREIMSAAISLERDTKIAYLGPEGTYTHQAAKTRFGSSVTYVPETAVADVFTAVQKRVADYGVVPIENSTEGSVNPTLDELTETPLKIYSEVCLPIEHHLLSRVKLDEVQTVYSHPQVFGQCRHWLAREMPTAAQVPTASTALAAARASTEEGCAAIAGRLAAELHGLPVIAEQIQDEAGNATRFFVIGHSVGQRTGRDKTSVVFRVHHKVGALYDALGSFRSSGLNMSKIESRPSGQKAWEYWFFVDIEGHSEEKPVKEALAELGSHCLTLTVLGSYPSSADPVDVQGTDQTME